MDDLNLPQFGPNHPDAALVETLRRLAEAEADCLKAGRETRANTGTCQDLLGVHEAYQNCYEALLGHSPLTVAGLKEILRALSRFDGPLDPYTLRFLAHLADSPALA